MRKVTLFIISLLAVCHLAYASGMASRFEPDEMDDPLYTYLTRFDNIMSDMCKRKGAVVDSVRYTGSDIYKAGGFEWQRGSGRGWTTGIRTKVAQVGAKDAKKILDLFHDISEENFVNLKENHATTFFENSNTFYAFDYDPAARILCLLKVVAEDELSVPYSWKTETFVDATLSSEKTKQSSPFEAASENQMRLLALSRLWAGARRNYVFMNKVRLNWDSVYVSMMPKIEAAASEEEVMNLLQRMAALLGDGHTYVNTDGYTSLPIVTRLIDGRPYVVSVASNRIEDLGVKRGMEVRRINELPVDRYVTEEVIPTISSSTPQWTMEKAYGENLLRGFDGDSVYVTFADGDREFTLPFVYGKPRWRSTTNTPLFDFRTLHDGIAYLRIDNFMDYSFQRKFDKLYPEILKSKGLIIDLRQNPGGNSGNGDYILRHLSSDSIQTASWSSPLYMPAYASWGRDLGSYESKGDKMPPIDSIKHYTQPIVILVDGGTFSAAEDFCSVFRGMNRGVIVGTPTGGSTGNGVRVQLLPSGVFANICSKHDVGADGVEFVGIGIIPDIEARETYESFFSNRNDNAVEAALRYLQSVR